jgi:DNA-directed RNA polymerase subunit RPC12/RpoP
MNNKEELRLDLFIMEGRTCCKILTESGEEKYISLPMHPNSAEFQKILDKAEPKTLSYEGDGYADGYMVYDTAICPECGRYFEVYYEEHYNYCPTCGQKLDWSGYVELEEVNDEQ